MSNDRRGIVLALNWMANACVRQQAHDEALLYLKQARQIDLELGNKEGQAFNKSLIAYAYYRKSSKPNCFLSKGNLIRLKPW